MLAGEFAELNGDKYVAACKGMDEEALFESEAFAALKDALVAYALPKNIAALKRDLGKYRIDYDVWFHESTLHESGAVLAVVDKLLELGACYKAEDGAIMYRSAQYAAKYGTVNKKKTGTALRRRPRTRYSSAPTAFPPTLPPISPTTTTSWPPAALPRPSTSGVQTTTAMSPA